MKTTKILWAEILAIDTSRQALRSFGLTVGSVFLGIGMVLWWRHEWSAGVAEYWLWGIGGGLVVFGALLPALLRPIYQVWMGVAVVLGFFMTKVILTLVFFVAVMPIGLFLRVLGKDLLNKKQTPGGNHSYWVSREEADVSPERLTKYY